jgi:hypothetical protein
MTAQIKIVDAFMCSSCKKIYKKELDVEKCINKHNKEKNIKEKENNFRKFIHDKYLNIFKNNLVPTNPNVALSRLEKLGPALIITADVLNQDLKINDLKILNVKKEKISFKISGEINRKTKKQNLSKILQEYGILKKDYKKFIIKYYYIDKIINSNYSIYFSDIMNIIPEIKTCSGGGGQHFSYNLELGLNQYKDMQNEIEDFFALKKQRDLYIDEKNKLKLEYEKERLPSVLISDVSYAVMQSDLENLQIKQKELLSLISDLSQKIKIRKEILLEKDSINIPLPDNSFNFDQNRFNEILNYITIK